MPAFDWLVLTSFEAILAFQIVFIALQGWFLRQREYLYYLAYMLVVGVFALVKYSETPLFPLSTETMHWLELNLDKSLPMLSYFFYYRFARHFVDMPIHFPTLNTWIIRLEYTLLGYVAIESILVIAGATFWVREAIFQVMAFLLFFSSVSIIVAFVRRQIVLTYFIVAGALVLSLGSMITMAMLVAQNQGTVYAFNPMVVNLATTVFELVAFTTGLAYKSKLIEIEKNAAQQLLIVQLKANLALQENISRIREDAAHQLHSDVASGLSDIAIMATVASKNATPENSNPNALLSQIRYRSSEMIDSIQDLIWALNPQHTSLEHLHNRMLQLAREQYTPVGVKWRIEPFQNQGTVQPNILRNVLSVWRLCQRMIPFDSITEVFVQLSPNRDTLHIQYSFHPNPPQPTGAFKEKLIFFRSSLQMRENLWLVEIPVTIFRD